MLQSEAATSCSKLKENEEEKIHNGYRLFVNKYADDNCLRVTACYKKTNDAGSC